MSADKLRRKLGDLRGLAVEARTELLGYFTAEAFWLGFETPDEDYGPTLRPIFRALNGLNAITHEIDAELDRIEDAAIAADVSEAQS